MAVHLHDHIALLVEIPHHAKRALLNADGGVVSGLEGAERPEPNRKAKGCDACHRHPHASRPLVYVFIGTGHTNLSRVEAVPDAHDADYPLAVHYPLIDFKLDVNLLVALEGACAARCADMLDQLLGFLCLGLQQVGQRVADPIGLVG